MQEALALVLASKPFRRARRRRRLLAYLVAETLAGRGDVLKEYSIARDVYNLPEDFDPRADPRVRVEVRRLRQTLARYYREEGPRIRSASGFRWERSVPSSRKRAKRRWLFSVSRVRA